MSEGGSGRLTVALGEYDIGWHDPDASLAGAAALVERATMGGARLVALPEMCTTGFTMDVAQATELEGPIVRELGQLAARCDVWLVAGVALREERAKGGACAVNAALVFDPAGKIVALHRKRKLFAYADEHAHYTAGDRATCVTVDGVRLGIFICYELRFPELFGEVARDVDAMILIANWPASRRLHWDTLLRARAIENQCYMVGVNRTGSGGGLAYDGGSAAFGPFGEALPPLNDDPLVVALDAARVAEVRGKFPFLKDR